MSTAAANDATAKVETADYRRLGKVSNLGPQESWEAALLLPSKFEDIGSATSDLSGIPLDTTTWFRLKQTHVPRIAKSNDRTSIRGQFADRAGRTVGYSIYQVTREVRDYCTQTPVLVVQGKLRQFSGKTYLNVTEVVPPEWHGRVRPTYDGKKNVIGPETVRERVLSLLPYAAPTAARHLEERLSVIATPQEIAAAVGCMGWSFEDIIRQAHLPRDLRYGLHAQRAMEWMAALLGLQDAHSNVPTPGKAKPLDMSSLPKRMAALACQPTPDQRTAMEGVASRLAGDTASRVLISGDVGFGKTACYQVPVAAAVDAGARVAVMAPNESLAQQASREFAELFPDIEQLLVTGATPPTTNLTTAPLLFGTTALLHRDTGQLDVTVIDEQQKFSVKQREALLQENTHLIEATATCIPRTMALAKFGVVDVFTLRKGHADKTIHNSLWNADNKRELFNTVRERVATGSQLLVLYPARAEGKANEEIETDLHNVAAAAETWEKIFPGRVRSLTSENDNKAEIIADMNEGRADACVCTSVVEVGLNLPGVKQVMVIKPHRFGLTSLHQIRGRASRLGGEGWFYMYEPGKLSDKAMKRLQTLLDTNDGFEVAERDLALRGFGSLKPGSTRQSGADGTVLFGRTVDLETLNHVFPIWEQLKGN